MKKIIAYILILIVLFAEVSLLNSYINATVVNIVLIAMHSIIFILLTFIFFNSEVISDIWRKVLTLLSALIFIQLCLFNEPGERLFKLILFPFFYYCAQSILNKNILIRFYKALISIFLLVLLFINYNYWFKYAKFVWFVVYIDIIFVLVRIIYFKIKKRT